MKLIVATLTVVALLIGLMVSFYVTHTGRSIDSGTAGSSAGATVKPGIEPDTAATPEGQDQPEPPFGHTADTVFDIITLNDPDVFSCLEYQGRDDRQIWDKRVNGEPTVNVFLYRARYRDGADIEIAVNPEFGTEEAARTEAMRYTKSLGQLPSVLRAGIKRFSVHKGDKSPHSGPGQIITYSETTTQRQSYDHWEETLFHESVHASWEAERLSPEWRSAQLRDGRFLTQYGMRKPEVEDLPEVALFAYAVSHYPGRIPPADTAVIIATVPERIKVIERLLPSDQAIFYADQVDVGCKP